MTSLNKFFKDPKYAPAFYFDKDDKVKTIVFEKANENQIAERKALMARQAEAIGLIEVGKPMKAIAIKDMDDNMVDLKDYKGKVIVLNFWFIGCKPCVAEMPHLNKFVEDYEDKGVVFLAVSLDNKEAIEKFLTKKQFDYTIAPNGRSIASELGITSYPTNIIIDKEGKIIYSVSGFGDHLMPIMDEKIEKLVKG